jgi:zinc protease
MRDDARYALELLTTLLDGQAGRLFLDLRERAGLAYDVWAQASSGLDGGTLRVGLATDPDRVEAAAAGLRRVLQGIVQAPPGPDELERARRQVAGRAAIESQRASSRAAAFARRDLLGDPPPLDELRTRLAAVTSADVVAVIARLLAAGTAEVRVMPRR